MGILYFMYLNRRKNNRKMNSHGGKCTLNEKNIQKSTIFTIIFEEKTLYSSKY